MERLKKLKLDKKIPLFVNGKRIVIFEEGLFLY